MKEEVDVLIRHLQGIRRQRAFEAAKFVFIIESNLCWVRAKSIYHAVTAALKRVDSRGSDVLVLCSNNKTSQVSCAR
jgi:hypothetical protein